MNGKAKSKKPKKTANRQRGIAFAGPFFAQVPQKLIRDATISRGARLLWGVVHTYAVKKDISRFCGTWISQKILAQTLGVSVRQVRRWEKELIDSGWADVIHQGLGKPDWIILYGIKRRR